MDIYRLIKPEDWSLPILISVPHCGTHFSGDIRAQMRDHALESLDTDWYVDQLYSFCQDMGIGMVAANFSRYVVDLNRNPAGGKLYQDNRKETQVVPLHTFSGDAIYPHGGEPDSVEIGKRVAKYHTPYYQCLTAMLNEMKARHGTALLFDAHSIKSAVPALVSEKFPQLIVGDAEGKSCHPKISQTCLEVLGKTDYSLGHNSVFKGGYITRSFGKPDEGIHSIQLEMVQDLYMDETTNTYLGSKAEVVQQYLSILFRELGRTIKEIK